MRKLIKASLIATAVAALPGSVFALGAGSITVFSGIGQPLRAEVPINATVNELQTLSARLAPREEFVARNVPYPGALRTVRLSINKASRPVLLITSDQPVSEPFLDLLIDFSWSGGSLRREYTFLLDPVDLNAPRPIAVAQSAPDSDVPSVGSGATPDAPGQYSVRPGDTLHRVASRFRPDDVTLDQMLVALYRDNPSAFDGENMNRMRAGAILQIPDAASARALAPAEARREVRAQSRDFAQFRARLAGQVARAEPSDLPGERQVSGGAIAPRIEDRADDAVTDRVTLSQATPEPGDAPAVDPAVALSGERVRSLEEDLAARDAALLEATQRLAQLERSIRDLQALVELKSEQLAALQARASVADAATEPPPPVSIPAPPPLTDVAEPATEASAPPSAPVPAEPPSGPGPAAVADPAPPVPEPAPQPEPEPKPAPKPEPKPEAPPAAAVPAAPPVAPPEPPPYREPDLVEELLGNPMMLAAGGGVLVLLLGLLLMRLRQRRTAIDEGEPSALVTESPYGPPSVFGATGGQNVDTGASSVLHTDFSQTGLGAIDGDEGVDPVAEAEVYMAYGRDEQAEEILVDALKADPSRYPVYVKLLEIHANRKDLKAFETVAAELYARTSGEGNDWRRAAAMGRELDPKNPLYFGNEAETQPGDIPEAPAVRNVAAGVVAAAGAAAAMAGSKAVSAEPQEALTGAEVPAEEAGDVDVPLDDLDFDLPDADADADISEASSGTDEGPSEDELVDSNVLDFDLGLDSVDDLASQPSEAEELAERDPLASDVEGLDFDLGDHDEVALDDGDDAGKSMTSTVIGTGASLEDDDATGEVGEADEDEALDFDLGELGDLPTGDTGTDEAFDPEATQFATEGGFDPDATLVESDDLVTNDDATLDLENTRFDSSMLDFDLDLDSAAVEGDDADALELTDVELDLGDGPDAADPPAASAQAVEPADAGDVGQEADDDGLSLDFELPEVDLPEPGGADVAAQSGASGALDDLDLPDLDAPPATGGLPEPLASADDDGFGDGGLDDDAGEMDSVETKLELARAYEEMGDMIGARELLEEVMQEGSATQQGKAREALEKLG